MVGGWFSEEYRLEDSVLLAKGRWEASGCFRILPSIKKINLLRYFGRKDTPSLYDALFDLFVYKALQIGCTVMVKACSSSFFTINESWSIPILPTCNPTTYTLRVRFETKTLSMKVRTNYRNLGKKPLSYLSTLASRGLE